MGTRPIETLRPHTREERRAILAALVPRIEDSFGDRLVALAVDASVARNDDGPYSDLELVAIVNDGSRGGRGVIHEGMLIELEWTTEEAWANGCREVGEHWPLAGSSRLSPLIGDEVIERLNARVAEDLEAKCHRRARSHFHEVQESTGKVLGAIAAGNRAGLGLLVWDMVLRVAWTLALLNATPYTTYASVLAQARRLPRQPSGFSALVDALADSRGFADTVTLGRLVEDVYTDLERIHVELGIPLGVQGLDALSPDYDPE